MALGAERVDVLRMVVRQGLRLLGLGTAIGVVCAFAVTKVLRSMLFGVQHADALTYFTVTAALIGVSLLATCIPARRATKVDPLVALRYE